MIPELWEKTYQYIEQSVVDAAQDDVDSDFATECYLMGIDIRDLVREVWDDIHDRMKP